VYLLDPGTPKGGGGGEYGGGHGADGGGDDILELPSDQLDEVLCSDGELGPGVRGDLWSERG